MFLILEFLCCISSLVAAVTTFTEGRIDLALAFLICTILWASDIFFKNETLIKKEVMKKPRLILISSILPLCIAGAIVLFVMGDSNGWILLLGSIFWALFIVSARTNR